MARKKNSTPTTVESIRHNETRKNIPTNELRDFVADYEASPAVVLYPRDPSLDPQLVWQGKDEQDARDLAVEVVPIYIQEKIHPQAIIQDLMEHGDEGQEQQLDLFADFNGIEDFGQRVDFYQHDQHWSNRMILGDSLAVMTSLAEKEGLKGKVQMIYLDPPYGIKFGSNWQVSTRKRDVRDGKAEDATRQPEQVRAFRDTWKLGIHSYLAYLRDRLVIARELLTETGSIFAQIGDENVHLVRCLLDEIFGSENFIAQISFVKSSGMGARLIPKQTDYLVWYGRDAATVKFRQLFKEKGLDAEGASAYQFLQEQDGNVRRLTSKERTGLKKIPDGGRVFRYGDLTKPGPGRKYQISLAGKTFDSGSRWWGMPEDSMYRALKAGRVVAQGLSLAYIRYLEDFVAFPYTNVWDDTGTGSGLDKVYVVQTDSKVIQRCILMATDPGDLVLDPTCGSGTTAYVSEQWGRRWITIDTSRVALALARTRLMSAKYPYYLLADSPEGTQKEAELTGQMPPTYQTANDVSKGFVYKRVPHITLKAIANNAEIDVIHERWQPALDELRGRINQLTGQSWEEWELPREAGDNWPEAAKSALAEWWQTRRQRQQQIDDSIARTADQELLYDQPYEDNKRVRVAGPFTVESLSPHRMLPADEDMDGNVSEQEAQRAQDFATMILDNLRVAGVQNTIKNQRLKFDILEPYAGTWLQAAGEYTESDGTVKRVAVSIGPEYGTVGPTQVKEAAKEAVQGLGFDLLIICGFAFDPHVSEETKRYGRLTVLPARMNPDLAMGDELLKKTGAGNLFMVFGEPDVDIRRDKDGRYTVEIKGVDVYDPTTGQIRSNSTDDIACWFIDTDYNEESFFVRHAYFTGAGDPYDKLKRALRAEIDPDAWEALYSTVSRPFAPPRSGKIAVKVINHYGDEVMKVFEVE